MKVHLTMFRFKCNRRSCWECLYCLCYITDSLDKQECIPVGCVPTARRPYAGVYFPGGGLLLGAVCSGGGGKPSAPGVCVCSGGSGVVVSAPGGGVVSAHGGGGVCSGGSAPGGCVLPRGVCSGGFPTMH